MSEGYYAKRDSAIEYWVHNEHSHDQVMALRYLPDLLCTLELKAAFTNANLLDYGDQKHFFNVAYRGDFAQPVGCYTCFDQSKNLWQCDTKCCDDNFEQQQFTAEPKQISGCELVLPLYVPDEQLSGKWQTDHKLTIGIAPFVAYEKANQFRLDPGWNNENINGKNMNHSAILNCESPWKDSEKLFVGLLHGIGGRTLSKSALDNWLNAMVEQYQTPTDTMVLFAPVMSIGHQGRPVYQWYGIYQLNTPEQNTQVLTWTLVKELVDQEPFWQAMLTTGRVHD
jgi:hypothetical protein